MKMEITGIEVWAHHGVFDSEKRDGQAFFVDVTWWMDSAQAVLTDDLARTIDYSVVANRVVALMRGESVDLIETAADRVCGALADEFPMESVQIRLHKPHAPMGVPVSDVSCTTVARPGSGSSRHVGSCPSRQVVFSLGSNIEPRSEFLQFAVSALASTSGLVDARVSPVFETAAVGDLAQADFLNAVLIAETTLSAHDLLRRGLHVESCAKRRRDIPHGPRTLDVDLIIVGGESWTDRELILPHPRARDRAFVLLPWLALDPEAVLNGERVDEIVATGTRAGAFAQQRVTRLPGRLFLP